MARSEQRGHIRTINGKQYDIDAQQTEVVGWLVEEGCERDENILKRIDDYSALC